VLEFDAWADATRVIGPVVVQQESPYADYSQIGLIALSARAKHFVYPFKMSHQTDFDAAVTFLIGQAAGHVYIDNVSLKRVVDSHISELNSQVPQQYDLWQNYPNPFNPTTTITCAVAQAGHVRISVYNVLGELVENIVDSRLDSGIHSFNVDASPFSAGVYFYEMVAASSQNGIPYRNVKKMMVLK